MKTRSVTDNKEIDMYLTAASFFSVVPQQLHTLCVAARKLPDSIGEARFRFPSPCMYRFVHFFITAKPETM